MEWVDASGSVCQPENFRCPRSKSQIASWRHGTMTQLVLVRLYWQVQCSDTIPGNDVILLHSLPSCDWKPENALRFSTNSRRFPIWNAFLSFSLPYPPPSEIAFDYKLAVANATSIDRWEGFPNNRRMTLNIGELLNHPQCFSPALPITVESVATEGAPRSIFPVQPSSDVGFASPFSGAAIEMPQRLIAVWLDCGVFGDNRSRLLPLHDSVGLSLLPASSTKRWYLARSRARNVLPKLYPASREQY